MAGATFCCAAADRQRSRANAIAGGVWWFIALGKEVDSLAWHTGRGETKYQTSGGWEFAVGSDMSDLSDLRGSRFHCSGLM